jgi:N-acetylgalactosamine-N,N'-diacetylbacillosaminyl-diphospho-undecaprenol 4-alpha-N-acetylgalactosaminyltransferase
LKPKKIALVGFRMSGGGCGRVMANLSKYFDKQDIEVHIIIFHDEVGYDYSGQLFNLGFYKDEPNTIFNKIKRFKKLKQYIKGQQFDFIIDFRFRKRKLQELLISKFIYKTKTIYTVHSSQLEHYLFNSRFWTYLIYGKSFKILAITSGMKKLIHDRFPRLNNVAMIYNPVIASEISQLASEEIDLHYQYILGIGQMNTDQKQFDKLIEAYAKSKLIDKNIKLVILGEGERKTSLQNYAKELGIEEHVSFLGFVENPFRFMKRAVFFVLSSWHEGHPMVLIEALCSGKPVVAFDCPTGPNEVVVNEHNGLLVENQNVYALVDAINEMAQNSDLLLRCSSNAQNSVEHFELDKIGAQWLELLNIKN